MHSTMQVAAPSVARTFHDAGCATGHFGKWHMGGEVDDPQRGFDHWVSFKGQGVYYTDPAQSKVPGRPVPLSSADGYNVNGQRWPQRGYITDELTDFALEWLKSRAGQDRLVAEVSVEVLGHLLGGRAATRSHQLGSRRP